MRWICILFLVLLAACGTPAATVPTSGTASPEPTIGSGAPTTEVLATLATEAPSPEATLTAAPTDTPEATATLTPTETIAPTARPAAKPTITPAPRATNTPAPAAQNFDHNGDGKVTCADFKTQAEAKAALAAGYTKLDNDGDGTPFESFPPG